MIEIPRYMVVKIYHDKKRVAEFIDARSILESYLFSLREIGRDYELYVYSSNVNWYVFERKWEE